MDPGLGQGLMRGHVVIELDAEFSTFKGTAAPAAIVKEWVTSMPGWSTFVVDKASVQTRVIPRGEQS